MKWYRQYAIEAHYETGKWFQSGGWWLLPAAWALIFAPPVFLLYFLMHCGIFLAFLPFFLISRIRRLM